MDLLTPRQIPQEVEEDDRRPWVLMWCFVALAFLTLYSLFPNMNEERPRFWLSDQLISFQAWVDYAAVRVGFCVLFWNLRQHVPRFRRELDIYFKLSVGYLLDYFIIYNDPIARVGVIPVSYTLFMLILAGIVTGRTFYTTWK